MLLSKTYKRHFPDNIAPVSPKLKKIVPPINIEPLPKLGEGLMDKQFFKKKSENPPQDTPVYQKEETGHLSLFIFISSSCRKVMTTEMAERNRMIVTFSRLKGGEKLWFCF